MKALERNMREMAKNSTDTNLFSRGKNIGDIDINTVTMEQYIALIRDNNRSGVVKPKIGNDISFEIKSHFIKELRHNLYVGTEDEDAHEHVRRHDLNNQHKVQIFYTGFDIHSCKMLDSLGFILMMTLTQALKSIQVMADHSHNWYDGAATRQRSNDSLNDIDMQKLNETIHAIQKLDAVTKNLEVKVEKLTQAILTNEGHLKKQEDDPYITCEYVYMIGFSKRITKEELELLIAKDTRSYLTEIKAHSFTVNTYEKSEPFSNTQQLNPLHEESQSSRSSTIPSSITNEVLTARGWKSRSP
nr:hypothetical protein [Tanacetum cinerariifolium]GEX45946.1 hypothetical protein [Tanacetum cinerariifolium]